jgi:hypothetical protein
MLEKHHYIARIEGVVLAMEIELAVKGHGANRR